MLLAVRQLLVEFLLLVGRVFLIALNIRDTHALLGNRNIELLQLTGQAVPLLGGSIHALFELGNALTDLFELLFLHLGQLTLGILPRGGSREAKQQKGCEGSGQHGRRV